MCGERTLATAQKLSERTNRARIISICPLHNIVGVIEYLPSRETWEELYIRALCPIHSHHLFISWAKIIEDRDVQNDPVFDEYMGSDYEGIRFIKPLNVMQGHDESLFVCAQCRKDSGHKLSFLEKSVISLPYSGS